MNIKDKDAWAEAEATLIGNLGRGTINCAIVGRNQAAILQTLYGFEKITDGNTLGAHLFGTYNGASIIRVSEEGLLPGNNAILLFKGSGMFDAPLLN